MSGKGGKRGIAHNILEVIGEYWSQKIGKGLGDVFLAAVPAAAAKLAGIKKSEILQILPFIMSFMFLNDVEREAAEGFIRGLTQALQGMTAIPDKLEDQKGYFQAQLGPLFTSHADALKKKASALAKGLIAAAVGLSESEREALWLLIAGSNEVDKIYELGRSADVTTEELRVIIGMGFKFNAAKRLKERLSPPAKPESILNSLIGWGKGIIVNVFNTLKVRFGDATDPKSAMVVEKTKEIGRRATAEENRLRVLRRHP